MPGRPPAIWTSTVTRGAATPASARLCSTATDMACPRTGGRDRTRAASVGRGRWREARFELRHAGFHPLQLFACLEQNGRLRFEFGASDDVEPRESALQQRLHVLLDVLRRAVLDRLADPRREVVERLAVEVEHRVPSA